MKGNDRYNLVAITLHWVMALAFFAMLGSGVAMVNFEIDLSFKFKLYQWHKSLGVLLLLTFFIRIGWRLFHKPPALPSAMKSLDMKAAKWGHWGLYTLMIALPLSGWVMVSSSPYGLPTIVFGWFEWPHINAITGNDFINGLSKSAHEILGWIFMAMIAAHIGAVAKHYIFEKINLLPRIGIGRTK